VSWGEPCAVSVDLGKPFLPLFRRADSGYLRFVDDDGLLEIVAALPTGQGELGAGLACTDGEDLTGTTQLGGL
jgi:hypothetical protein